MNKDGLYILVADGYSQGMNLLNPRLLKLGYDCFGEVKYWEQFNMTDEEAIVKYELHKYALFKIIRV